MAAHTVAAGDMGKHEIALAAATEDTVTFTGRSLSQVEISVLSGTKPVYFRTDATTAVSAADGTRAVYPGTSVVFDPGTSGATVVRLISAAAAVVSVVAVPRG